MPLPYRHLLHPRPALTNCKSCRTQHWELPHDAHKTQTYNICMTKHSYFPYTSTYSSTPHNTNRKHHIHYTNTQHIHTYIVSRCLATRCNNKILRTPLPHISSSEERLPHLTRCTIAQLRTNKSPILKSYLHKVDTKSHPSPICSLCNTHTTHTISSTAPTYAPHCHLWIYGHTPLEWWNCLLVDQKRDDQTSPQTRVKGVGGHNNNRFSLKAEETQNFNKLIKCNSHRKR